MSDVLLGLTVVGLTLYGLVSLVADFRRFVARRSPRAPRGEPAPVAAILTGVTQIAVTATPTPSAPLAPPPPLKVGTTAEIPATPDQTKRPRGRPRKTVPELPGDVLLRYRDVQGEVTERRITPRAAMLDGDEVTGFDGICHLRRQQRSFRFDRVISMSDASTGEVVDDTRAWIAARGLLAHV